MDLGLSGRAALVTAASKGLGLASARALAAEGAKVLISSRGEASLDAARRTITGEVETVAADMTDPATAAALVEATIERFGRLDVVVANNGGPPPGRALEVDDDQVRAAVEANLLSSVRLIRAALPSMEAASWGRICCITSYSVKQPIPTLALSNLARTGLWAWVKTAAADVAPRGITINLACPGPHATDRMRQLGGSGPMGDPDDFGRIVCFLCSEPAAFVNGAAVMVDGGLSTGLL
ncbi:MAG TPA: SDR family oxidoreductase [Acidimicrobiales bacterium]|nr:SDR family oxidoreductase [Acidimicrobiales bacterium]